MEKQDIIPEEVKTPQEESLKGEEKAKTKGKSLNIILLVILLLLLVPALTLIATRGVLITNQKATEGKSGSDSEQEIIEEDCKCEKCVEKECAVLEDGKCKCPTLSATNSGWAIISVPELKVSIETPDYIMVQDIGTQEVTSTWDTRLWQVDYKQYLYFGNYVKTLS